MCFCSANQNAAPQSGSLNLPPATIKWSGLSCQLCNHMHKRPHAIRHFTHMHIHIVWPFSLWTNDHYFLLLCVSHHHLSECFRLILACFFYSVSPPFDQDPTLEFLRKFTIGLVSGTISSCVNIPFDVAKSRIQGPQPVPGEIKYRTCFQTMALVYREEG